MITFICAVVGILWILSIWGQVLTDKNERLDR